MPGGPEDNEKFECPGCLGRLGDSWQAGHKAKGRASLAAKRFGGDVAAVALPFLAGSDNVTAEVLCLAAARTEDSAVVSSGRAAAALALWIGEEFAATNRLRDCSGLNVRSLVALGALTPLLLRSIGRDGKVRGDLRAILPVYPLQGAEDGFPPEEGFLVHAKTGSLHYVRGLAGYIRLGRGEANEFGFAIFSIDLPRRRGAEAALAVPGATAAHRAARAWRREAMALEQEILRNWLRNLAG